MKAFSIPPHPPALQITKTCIYKTIGRVSIPIDIYVPEANFHCPPLMLYIHGVSTQLPGAYLLFHIHCDRSSLLPVMEAHCQYEAISVINAKGSTNPKLCGLGWLDWRKQDRLLPTTVLSFPVSRIHSDLDGLSSATRNKD